MGPAERATTQKAFKCEIQTWGSEVHETLVILMHSFNSLFWNLVPASPIMVRLKPHLRQRQQQRQSSVGCTHWLPGTAVCGQCTQYRRLYTAFQKSHFSQQSKHLAELYTEFDFIGGKEYTVPSLWRADAILDFSGTGCRPALGRLGLPCLARGREGGTQVGCCSWSSLQHGTACKNSTWSPQQIYAVLRPENFILNIPYILER